MDARQNADTLIVGRTDAYGALGLDAAISRAERFLALGVDAIFVAGLRTPDEYQRVARELEGAILSAAVFEGVDTPWLTPAALGEMGYAHVSFPASLVFRIVGTMHDTLAALRRHATGAEAMSPAADSRRNRGVLDGALDVAGWQNIESRFASGDP
jgi:2-methylisocitrate lyase-like PEP mutase family enzyme